MEGSSSQYALTFYQQLALIFVEPCGCPDLVRYLIRIIKDEQLNDSRNEHLALRQECLFDPALPMHCLVPISVEEWEAQKKVFTNIQCLRPGFLKVLVVSEENEGWRNHRRATYSKPYNMEIIPGMEEMSFPAKLKMLNVYLLEKFDIVEGSVTCFNIGWKGGTDEEDYGGVYCETMDRVSFDTRMMLGDKEQVLGDIKIL